MGLGDLTNEFRSLSGATQGYLMPGQSFVDTDGRVHEAPAGLAAHYMTDESNPAKLRVDYDPGHWKTIVNDENKKNSIATDRGTVPAEEGRE